MKDKLIMHRGITSKNIPENSIPAIKNCVNELYSVELDIHILKDNTIIVFHDYNLSRMTNKDKDIKSVTYDEIKNLKLLDTSYNIPTLKKILKVIDGKIPIYIEIKSIPSKKSLKYLFRQLDNYNGIFYLQSFNPVILYLISMNRPNYKIGLLSLYPKLLFINRFLKIEFISIPLIFLPSHKIQKLRRKYKIIGWSLKNKSDYEIYKEYSDKFICKNTIK